MVATALKPGNKALSYVDRGVVPVADDARPTSTAAIHKDFFLSSLRNSALVVVGVVVASLLLVVSLAALAVSRFHFRGRAVFIVMIVGHPDGAAWPAWSSRCSRCWRRPT